MLYIQMSHSFIAQPTPQSIHGQNICYTTDWSYKNQRQ
jgi:hypothetical protein